MSRFTNVLAAAVVAGGMGLATDANGQSGGCNGGNCPPGPTTQNPGTVINNNLSATGGAATATTGPVTATGGTAQAIGGAGGQGGQGGSTGPISITNRTAALAPAVGVYANGQCATGVSFAIGTFNVSAGAGYSWQDQKCMEHQAAGETMRIGALLGGVSGARQIAIGNAVFRNLYDGYNAAAALVTTNVVACPAMSDPLLLSSTDPALVRALCPPAAAPATVAPAAQATTPPRRVRPAATPAAPVACTLQPNFVITGTFAVAPANAGQCTPASSALTPAAPAAR